MALLQKRWLSPRVVVNPCEQRYAGLSIRVIRVIICCCGWMEPYVNPRGGDVVVRVW